jgi:hypothetical protein
MTPTDISGAVTFAAVFIALAAAHGIGDHWMQNTHQAQHKGDPGWPGRLACAAHVASYIATQAVALLLVWAVLRLALQPSGVLAALGISAVTHYIADRRKPLRRLALLAGKAAYLDHATVVRAPGMPATDTGPGTALFHLDQSLHIGAIFLAALAATAFG